MGEKWETRRNSRREMGEKWKTIRNLRQKMGVNRKQDNKRFIIFQQKQEKQGKNRKNRGGKHKKNRRKNTNKQGGKKQKVTRNTETRFWRGFGKCWKWKREQKQGLLECHKTTIREQKWCIGAGLGCRHEIIVDQYPCKNDSEPLFKKCFNVDNFYFYAY